MAAPEFEKSEEILEIVNDLIEKRADLFEGIEAHMIGAVLRFDKDAPPSQTIPLKIKGIRGPVAAISNKKYVIHGYKTSWERLSSSKKVAYVAYCLKQIDYPTETELLTLSSKGKDYEWGKTIKPDLQSFRSFINNLGPNWEDEREVPNILEDENVVV